MLLMMTLVHAVTSCTYLVGCLLQLISELEVHKTKQDKTKQNKTKQNKTKQNKTKHIIKHTKGKRFTRHDLYRFQTEPATTDTEIEYPLCMITTTHQ